MRERAGNAERAGACFIGRCSALPSRSCRKGRPGSTRSSSTAIEPSGSGREPASSSGRETSGLLPPFSEYRARSGGAAGRDCSRWGNRRREDGQPSFGSLQNFGDGAAAILFYAFDAPVLAGADLRSKPLVTRREMLRELISKLPDAIRFSKTFDASAAELMAAVRSNGLEGVVAKRRDSAYKPGNRSGAWVKVRANRGQELVIGGYIPASTTFDSILVGYYHGSDLI
jgi:hypothetical protein